MDNNNLGTQLFSIKGTDLSITEPIVTGTPVPANDTDFRARLEVLVDRGGPVWVLSGGREALPDTAKIVIARQSVSPVGDCLFGGMHSLTYRWID